MKPDLDEAGPAADAERGIERPSGGRERRRQMESKRSAAKIGLTMSMGALVATGLMRGRGARILHIWSGLALIGFSAWHHQLYRSARR